MKENVVSFKAESLEDIAQYFDQIADRCRTTRGDAAKAYAYRDCADILRRTKLEPPRKPRWLKIGEFVTETDGQMRTGLAEQWSSTGQVRVKFGSDGPTEPVHYSKLRPADVNEVRETKGEA